MRACQLEEHSKNVGEFFHTYFGADSVLHYYIHDFEILNLSYMTNQRACRGKVVLQAMMKASTAMAKKQGAISLGEHLF